VTANNFSGVLRSAEDNLLIEQVSQKVWAALQQVEELNPTWVRDKRDRNLAYKQLAEDIKRLKGKPVWKTLKDIAFIEDEWVINWVEHSHTYGRLPDEDEIRPWSIPASSGYLLHSLMVLSEAKTVLEIGTSLGYSSLWIASAIEKNGGQLHTCEIFQPKIKLFHKYLKDSQISCVTPIEQDALITVQQWDKKIDVLFLDADPENYLRYWHKLHPFLESGSILVIDNAIDHRDQMSEFCNLILRDESYKTSILSIDHGMLFSIKI
jgi:predicted O-methyltransferase YrrM